MIVKKGQTLFTVNQGTRSITFKSPVGGKVKELNKFVNEDTESLDVTTYEQNWICEIDADELDIEIPQQKIGKAAESLNRAVESINRAYTIISNRNVEK